MAHDSTLGSSNAERIGQGVSRDCRDRTTSVRKDDANGLRLIEIKPRMTVQKDWGTELKWFRNLGAPVDRMHVIYGGNRRS